VKLDSSNLVHELIMVRISLWMANIPKESMVSVVSCF